MNQFQELNPYACGTDVPIVATLVERPRPVKRRQPLVACLFLLCVSPFLVGTTITWVGIAIGWGQMRPPDSPGEAVGRIIGLVAIAVITLLSWLVAFICLRELTRWAFGR